MHFHCPIRVYSLSFNLEICFLFFPRELDKTARVLGSFWHLSYSILLKVLKTFFLIWVYTDQEGFIYLYSAWVYSPVNVKHWLVLWKLTRWIHCPSFFPTFIPTEVKQTKNYNIIIYSVSKLKHQFYYDLAQNLKNEVYFVSFERKCS